MLRLRFSVLVLLLAFGVGCAPAGDDSGTDGDGGSTTRNDSTSAADDGSGSGSSNAAGEASGDVVTLTPENTKIQFVGIHTGDKPDPRTGSFASVDGTAELGGGSLISLEVNIDTTSLTTDIERLTDHLKSPDFFDVRQHPTARFVSTNIEDRGDGTVQVTGDLTMLGTTQSISFPATVNVSDGLNLNAEFAIDRTQFGMDYSVDKVAAEVAMTVTVGG